MMYTIKTKNEKKIFKTKFTITTRKIIYIKSETSLSCIHKSASTLLILDTKINIM